MRLRLLPIALIVMFLASLAAMPASARHRDRDRDRRFDHRSRVIVVPQHYHHYHHRPHGWDHGHKRGWRGGHLPPGLARKYHRGYRHHHHYVDRRPAIILRFNLD
jgi:hypothetical protein